MTARKKPPNSAITPRLLGVADAAAYCSAHEWFIKTKVWSGELRAVRFGHKILIDQIDLDAFIEVEKLKVSGER
jgi:excisionase family DNA binding protein